MMSKNNKFFDEAISQETKVNFVVLESIKIKDKTFQLSGDFVNEKSEFAESILKYGGKVRGIREQTKHVLVNETDYFVMADAGINGKPYGTNAIKIQKHNDMNEQKRKPLIPIIKESHCKKLISEYLVRRSPKIR